MANTISKLNPEWITETRQYFLDFLELTKFPHPERNGRRGSSFDYPEWLICLLRFWQSSVGRKPIWRFIGWRKSIGRRLPKGWI